MSLGEGRGGRGHGTPRKCPAGFARLRSPAKVRDVPERPPPATTAEFAQCAPREIGHEMVHANIVQRWSASRRVTHRTSIEPTPYALARRLPDMLP